MCLTVNIAKEGLEEGKWIPLQPIKKAESEIRCYKILNKTDEGYFTPFRCTGISSLQIHGLTKFKAKFNPADKRKKIEDIFEDTDSHLREYGGYLTLDVFDGIIHTMKELPETQECFEIISPRVDHAEIWECAIPKGTKYMEGIGNGYSCLGSEAIRFIKKI